MKKILLISVIVIMSSGCKGDNFSEVDYSCSAAYTIINSSSQKIAVVAAFLNEGLLRPDSVIILPGKKYWWSNSTLSSKPGPEDPFDYISPFWDVWYNPIKVYYRDQILKTYIYSYTAMNEDPRHILNRSNWTHKSYRSNMSHSYTYTFTEQDYLDALAEWEAADPAPPAPSVP